MWCARTEKRCKADEEVVEVGVRKRGSDEGGGGQGASFVRVRGHKACPPERLVDSCG